MRRRFRLRILLSSILSIAFVSSALSADNVRVLADVAYKREAATEYERERCKLDLYLPPTDGDTPKGFATIVWFHGGALQGGDKSSGAAIAKRFAEDGIAVASVNYRLSPRVQFPAYIEDAAAAFAFVHANIAEHGGSPDRVFISGHSAGGYLTAMLGVDERYIAAHGLKSSDIAGLLPISGQMITHSTIRKERGISETQPLIDSAAPSYHARPDAPPFLNIAGSLDLPARAEESRYFIAAMRAAGHKDATYLEVEGRDHGSIANRITEEEDVVAKAMIDFIKRQRYQSSP